MLDLFVKNNDYLFRKVMFLILLSIPFLIFLGRSPLDLAISIIAVSFLIFSYYSRNFSWLQYKWVQVILLFWAFMVLNSFQAYDLKLALSRSVPYIRYPIFAVAVTSWIITNQKEFKLLILVFIASLIFAVSDGLFEFIVGYDFAGNVPLPAHLTGPFKISGLGIYLTKLGIPILIMAFYFLNRQEKWQLYVWITLFILTIITIILSGERMGILLMLFALLIIVFSFNQSRKFGIYIIVFTCTSLVGILIVNDNLQRRIYHGTINNLQENPLRSSGYKAQIHAALEIIADHPVFGVGTNNYRVVCKLAKYDRKPDGHKSRCLIHPHNVYLELWVNNGLIGVLIFLFLIVQWSKLFWHHRKEIMSNIVIFGSILGPFLYLWPLSVGMSIFSNFNGSLFWIAIALMLTSHNIFLKQKMAE